MGLQIVVFVIFGAKNEMDNGVVGDVQLLESQLWIFSDVFTPENEVEIFLFDPWSLQAFQSPYYLFQLTDFQRFLYRNFFP